MMRRLFLEIYRVAISATNNLENLRLYRIYRSIFKQIGFTKIIVIDVGAHHGTSIDFFLKHFEVDRILAFEPSRRSFELLKSKHNNTANVFLYNVAVGDTSRTQVFYESAITEMSSLTIPNSIGLRNKLKKLLFKSDRQANDSYEVAVTTLDLHYTNQKWIDKDIVIKIDTEGYEFYSLVGAQSLICSSNRLVLQIEIHRDKTRKKLESQIDSLLESSNYKKVAILRHYLDPTVLDVIYVSKNLNSSIQNI